MSRPYKNYQDATLTNRQKSIKQCIAKCKREHKADPDQVWLDEIKHFKGDLIKVNDEIKFRAA